MAAWTQKEFKRFSFHVRRCIEFEGGQAALLTPGLKMPNMTLRHFEKLKPYLSDITFCHAIIVSIDDEQGDKRKIDTLLFAHEPNAIWQRVQDWTYNGQKNASVDLKALEDEDDEDEEKQHLISFIELLAEIRKQARHAIETHFNVTLKNTGGH